MWRNAMVLSLLIAVFAGCGGDGDHAGPGPSPVVTVHGVRLRLEPGWHLAATNLTPDLVRPRDILSVGTFPMEPGGACDQAPSRAYSEMGQRDGLITILESGGKISGFPPRPPHFRIPARRGSFECAPHGLNAQEFLFSDAGRHFYAFVALGDKGPLRQAESILDSFTARATLSKRDSR